MSEALAALFLSRISTGLKRQALTTCADWACEYRVMGKPYPGQWSFKHHPWLKEMHNSKAELNVGMKAAQVGFTELLLNWAFYNIDLLGESVLYVLPTDDNANDFSAARFDSALELSPYLNTLFSDVKNVRHKRAGSSNLYIRGSKSKNNLISIPVARMAIDELNKMVIANIALAMERLSGQVSKQVWFVSTPTIPGFGIDSYFLKSTMSHYFIKCLHCSKHIDLDFPRNLLYENDSPKTARLVCHECGGILPHETKDDWCIGEWVDAVASDIKGFYVNQLYSRTVSPQEFVESFLRGIVNPADEQEFYNSKLGKPHLVEGSRVSDSNIEDCVKGYLSKGDFKNDSIITMGVDVGKWLHCEVCEWTLGDGDLHTAAIPRVLEICKVLDFAELDQIILRYGVNYTVIDANPERRESLKLCGRFYGIAKACFYGRDQKSKEIVLAQEAPTATVDRTSWLDISLGRFRSKRIELPKDTPLEYKEHIKNLVKIYEKDDDGNPIAKYVNGDLPDHYAHARNYAEIALSLAVNANVSTNITGVTA